MFIINKIYNNKNYNIKIKKYKINNNIKLIKMPRRSKYIRKSERGNRYKGMGKYKYMAWVRSHKKKK